MQSEIFQAFICYKVDDYGLQLKKMFPKFKVFIGLSVSHNHHNYDK